MNVRILAFLILSLLLHSTSSSVSTTETQMLIQMYRECRGEIWQPPVHHRTNTSWGVGPNHCLWSGVNCENDVVDSLNVRMYGMDCSNNGTATHEGSPSMVFPAMRLLAIGFNNLVSYKRLLGYDIDPVRGGSMPKLMYLKAIACTFTGTIPSLLNAPNLKEINFANNRLTGTLPVEWGVIHKDVELVDVSQNQDVFGTLPSSWGSWKHVQVINVAANHLSGTVPLEWSQGTLKNTLKSLDI
eukprot:PhF_6_TR42165/c0_g1_i3/m.63732